MLGRAQHSLLGPLRRAQAVTDEHATKRPCQRRCRMPKVRTGHYLRHADEHLWKNMGLTRLAPDSLAILIPIVSRQNPIGPWCPMCDNEVAETFTRKRRDSSLGGHPCDSCRAVPGPRMIPRDADLHRGTRLRLAQGRASIRASVAPQQTRNVSSLISTATPATND